MSTSHTHERIGLHRSQSNTKALQNFTEIELSEDTSPREDRKQQTEKHSQQERVESKSPDYVAPGIWRPKKGGLIKAPDGYVYRVAGEFPKRSSGFFSNGVEVWCYPLRGDPPIPPHFPFQKVRPANGMQAGQRWQCEGGAA